MTGGLLINVDVPDLERGVAFYAAAFGLSLSGRIGDGVAELQGWPATLYLLEKPAGSPALPGGAAPRDYARHWTPVHLDVVVEDVTAARDRALAAGAVLERDVATAEWGDLALLADPFGNGFCLIAFRGRGYGEIA
jgi:predicted enzyme related to lactoylglutathione lyase